jgi:hypothetical protein
MATAFEQGFRRKRLEQAPRFPADQSQLIRKLTDLHKEISEVVNRIVDGYGDVLVDSDQIGVVLKDSTGHYWRVTVSSAGALTTTDLGTTRP